MNRNGFLFILAPMMIAILFSGAVSSNTFATQNNQAQKSATEQKPPILSLPITKDSAVSVTPQADAPIAILLREVFARDPLKPGINFSVEGKSAKPVRIIAIRYDAESSTGKSSGLVYDNPAALGWAMKNGQSQGFTYQYVIKEGTLKQLTLSVDYVEFADGTTWGPDAFKSVDRVAGRRAGAEAERELLLKMLTESGAAAVVKAIEAGLPDRTAPPGHSPEWGQNFNLGAKALRTRVRVAQFEGGAANVEALLRKPFDIMG